MNPMLKPTPRFTDAQVMAFSASQMRVWEAQHQAEHAQMARVKRLKAQARKSA